MNHLEKALAMLLSFVVVFLGSTGIAGRGEQKVIPNASKALFLPSAEDTSEQISADEQETEIIRTAEFREVFDALARAELWDEPISRGAFLFLLTGAAEDAENNDEYLTREEAATILFSYLTEGGYVPEGEAGNLSLFQDGINTSPQYAQAAAELYGLSGLTLDGDHLRPKDLLSRKDAVYMILTAQKNSESESGGSSLLHELLECSDAELMKLEGMLACMIGAMLCQQIFAFSGEPDVRFASLTMLNAISWALIPERLCAYLSPQVVVLTQADMRLLYAGMFAKGSFSVFDPAVSTDNVSVLGDSLVFFPVKKQDINVAAGTAIAEPDGSVTVCCTVYALGEYCCTGYVNLCKSDGWAAGHSVCSITLSMG
jgi:hypothetical protein